VSILRTGASALGKLLVVIVLAATFLFGMVGAVYLSLRGDEVKVPEVVGKDFYQSEKEIEDLGLKLKRRATRYSQEKPNTVLEQLPKPGETVKTGQTILVVLSEANPDGNEAPATIQKDTPVTQEDDSTDVTPEKPVKTNKNANVKKPSQTTRDVIANKPNKNSNTADGNSANSKSMTNDTNKGAGNKNGTTNPAVKPATPSNTPKSDTVKPATAKTPNNGDTRTRKVQ
jgi:beta-lactam-binding protein with PASTA domain